MSFSYLYLDLKKKKERKKERKPDGAVTSIHVDKNFPNLGKATKYVETCH